MRPYLLFDFDGTIADSLGLGLELMNKLAPKYHLKPISDQELQHLRSIPTHKAIQHVNIPFYKLPVLIPVFLHEYRHILDHLQPFDGIKECLHGLQQMGIRMALLTSNSKENVHHFLDIHDMNYFEWVEGGSGLFKKQITIAKQIKKHDLDNMNIIYIGDESRDIIAAKKCGIKIISVAWGFHTRELLEKFNPDYIVDTPQEIYNILINS